MSCSLHDGAGDNFNGMSIPHKADDGGIPPIAGAFLHYRCWDPSFLLLYEGDVFKTQKNLREKSQF